MSRPTAPRTTHPAFNSPDGDVCLVSSDNVAFRVEKTNLMASSVVFRDMFEVGAGGEEVAVAEGADVLATVLPYCYPEPVEPLNPDTDSFWITVKAFDKYQTIIPGVFAGIICGAVLLLREPLQSREPRHRCEHRPRRAPADVQSALTAFAKASGLPDDGKLVELLHRRQAAHHTALHGLLGGSLVARIHDQAPSAMAPEDVAETIEVWLGAGSHLSKRGLRAYRERVEAAAPDAVWLDYSLMPWEEMEEALRGLPDSL